MAKATEISAADWLAVRERIALTLKENSPRAELSTRRSQAEALITAGFVDVEFVRDALKPKPSAPRPVTRDTSVTEGPSEGHAAVVRELKR